MASEGVVLDIIGGNAIFTSLLTNHVILTRCLKTVKSTQELILLIDELYKKSWFNKSMQNQIENEVLSLLRGI